MKKDINNELIRIYTDAGLDKEELKVLLSDAKMWIKEKKDITNALKLVDKIEKVNNLTSETNTKATETREYTDFSKYKEAKDNGIEPEPDKITQKVVVTSQITDTEVCGNDDFYRENTQTDAENSVKTQEEETEKPKSERDRVP